MKGRKRHICVEVLGLVLSCYVGAANQADVKAAPAVLVPALETYASIEKILADQGYRGDLAESVEAAFGCLLELTKKLQEGFVVQPWRWIVERTNARARKCQTLVSRLRGATRKS